MIQSSQVINRIGKQRLIHSNPIQRSLRNICYDASLPEQSADISTSIVISVYNESTGLTDIGFVNLARFIQSFTSAAKLRSMIRVDFTEKDNILFAQTTNTMKQFSVRNFVNNSISSSAFRIPELFSGSQILQILYDNRSVINFTQINNFMGEFPAAILNEIIFISFQPFERFESFLRTQIGKTPKLRFSSFDNLPLDKYFFSKIEMPNNFFIFRIINGNGNIISISIYTNNVLAVNRFFEFLFNKNLNSKVFENKYRTNTPTLNKIFGQSLISSILNNWKMNSFSLHISCDRNNKQSIIVCFYRKHSFIESNRYVSNFVTDFSFQKNLKKRSLNKSRLKLILFSEVSINHRLKLISTNALISFPNRKNFLRTSEIFRIQFRDFSRFGNCGFSNIYGNYLLHRNEKYNNLLFINLYNSQFIYNLIYKVKDYKLFEEKIKQ